MSGTLQRQREFLNILRFLGNVLQLSIVGVDIKDAYLAIQSDNQLENRFEPLSEHLCDWIRRIAKVYEIGYPIFCKKVLNLTSEKIQELGYYLPEKAIHILSVGTAALVNDLLYRNLGTYFRDGCDVKMSRVEQ